MAILACNGHKPGLRSLAARALLAAALVLGATAVSRIPAAAEIEPYKTADGLTIYLGILPAALVKGHPADHPERTMHGGVPRDRHEYHLVAAIFDSATGARISDARVTARVSGLGMAGEQKALEPMLIAGTVTYGAFFELPGTDRYTIRLEIQRAAAGQPVVADFTYRHAPP